jgi:hypothetical protein
MPKIHAVADIQTLKQPLETAYALLKRKKIESIYAGSINLNTGETKELTHLIRADAPRVNDRNKALQTLCSTIKALLETPAEDIEKNMALLVAVRENAAEFIKKRPYNIEREPEGLENVTEFFRTLLNYLDHLITWVRCGEKTCAETYTPGAQALKGRPHFLNAPKTNLGTALNDFEHACNNLKLDDYKGLKNN